MKNNKFGFSLIFAFTFVFLIFSADSASAATYEVKSGDSLWKIANEFNITVNDLKEWNNLSSEFLQIGQKLIISKSDEETESKQNEEIVEEKTTENEQELAEVKYDIEKLIEVAKQQLKTPYRYGGSSPGGFDCSGFIHYVYNQAGFKFNRGSSKSYFDMATTVETPQIGDLVFFKNTYIKGISHTGIYIGNNEFIHASSSKGIIISNLNEKYWSKHFNSFGRF